MRKLSDYKPRKKYVYCSNCKEIFIDDVLNYGSLFCPNECGNVLERGIMLEDGKFFKGVISLQKGELE